MKFVSQHVKITDSMKTFAEEKLANLSSYLTKDEFNSLEVKFSKEGRQSKVELSVNYLKLRLRVVELGEDYYDLIDDLRDKLVRKINKRKFTIKDKSSKELTISYTPVEKEKIFILDKETYEDAVKAMNDLGHNFYVYKDYDSNEFTVIYHRNNGSIGKIVCR